MTKVVLTRSSIGSRDRQPGPRLDSNDFIVDASVLAWLNAQDLDYKFDAIECVCGCGLMIAYVFTIDDPAIAMLFKLTWG